MSKIGKSRFDEALKHLYESHVFFHNKFQIYARKFIFIYKNINIQSVYNKKSLTIYSKTKLCFLRNVTFRRVTNNLDIHCLL